MAPYLRSINSDRTELIQKLEEKNKQQVEEYDRKLKDAEENEGDSEISELLRNKAMYFVRIGDKVRLCLVVWRVESLIEMIGIVGASAVGFGDCD